MWATAKDKTMQLQCHACGKKFRSMSAEAKHRHNFPAMCTRNRQFERFTAQVEQKARLSQAVERARSVWAKKG